MWLGFFLFYDNSLEFFFLFVSFIKMLNFWGICVDGSEILNGRTQEEREKVVDVTNEL